MKANTKKILSYLLRGILALVAIVIIWNKVDFKQVGQLMLKANFFWLGAAFLVFFLSKLISSFRLNVLFRELQLHLGYAQNFRLYLLGMFYNLFIPGVGGDGYKVFLLNKHYRIPAKALIGASLLDRISGMAALCILTVIFFVSSSYEMPYKEWFWGLIPLGVLVYVILYRRFYPTYRKVLLASSAYSIAVQSTQLICAWFILLALGVDAHIKDYLLVFLLSSFAYIIPVVGAREMAFVFGAEVLLLNKELSLSISLFFYCGLALTSLLGVLYLFRPSRLELPEVA